MGRKPEFSAGEGVGDIPDIEFSGCVIHIPVLLGHGDWVSNENMGCFIKRKTYFLSMMVSHGER